MGPGFEPLRAYKEKDELDNSSSFFVKRHRNPVEACKTVCSHGQGWAGEPDGTEETTI